MHSAIAHAEADPAEEQGSEPRSRVIQVWTHGCFFLSGSAECFGSVSGWTSDVEARLQANKLAQESVKELLSIGRGQVVSSKTEVSPATHGTGYAAQVTVHIAVGDRTTYLPPVCIDATRCAGALIATR